MTAEAIYSTEKYIVVTTDVALNEAGTACDAPGYAVVNKDTGITEHTSLCLPAAMFQADNFNRTLVQLTAEQDVDDVIEGEAAPEVEDVTTH